MATYDHDAIYKAYPNVVTIRDQSEKILDKDGNGDTHFVYTTPNKITVMEVSG